MKKGMNQRAVSVYYPDRDSPLKYEVKLSKSGAKKGMAIGAMISSRVPNPLAVPVCTALGGIVGAVFGEAD